MFFTVFLNVHSDFFNLRDCFINVNILCLYQDISYINSSFEFLFKIDMSIFPPRTERKKHE